MWHFLRICRRSNGLFEIRRNHLFWNALTISNRNMTELNWLGVILGMKSPIWGRRCNFRAVLTFVYRCRSITVRRFEYRFLENFGNYFRAFGIPKRIRMYRSIVLIASKASKQSRTTPWCLGRAQCGPRKQLWGQTINPVERSLIRKLFLDIWDEIGERAL